MMNGHAPSPQSQYAFNRTNIDSQRYPEFHKDHANLLMKEGLALNIQLYYENNCQVLIPTQALEDAMNNGDIKSIFQKVNQKEIKSYMAMVFDQPAPNGSPESQLNKNPYVFVEKCSLQFHIFSYRMVDFPSLFNFLNHYLSKKQDGGADKTPRYNDPLSGVFDGRKSVIKGSQNLVQMYKNIQEEQFKFFRNEFSLKFALVPEGVNIAVNVTPELLFGLKSVNEFIDNFYLAQDLKQYRPQRRPITASQIAHMTKKQLQSETFARKRRNIVRDWLYFIVWYVRLKKILDKHKETSANISLAQMLKGFPAQPNPETVLKSPVQDPTQLSKLDITTNVGRVQIKIFESHKKMMDYYSIINQGFNNRN